MPDDLSFRSARIEGASEDQLQAELRRLRATDGLPVILPTPERVEQMLFAAAIAGYDRDLVIGEVGPNMGEATVEKIAINAVMAGCGEEHLPVVIAAISALCDPVLDTYLTEVTTHQVTPMLIVNGPAAEIAGVASGFGALGYGHRGNLCIGRAVRLCLINLGGTWPGLSAMSVLSQPATLAYCLAEDEAASPFEPLQVALGYAPEQSVVTVTGQGAPVSVFIPPTEDGSPMGERILELLALAIANPANNVASGGRGTVVVILSPDHARALHQDGYGRAEIARELSRRAVNPLGLMRRLRGGLPPYDMETPFPAISHPEDVLVLVAGGPGVYSTVTTPWGGGPHNNTHVSREIVFSDSCEVGGH